MARQICCKLLINSIFSPRLDFPANLGIIYPGHMPKKSTMKKKLSRKEQRDLDIEIGFLEGVIKRDPVFVDALRILGDDYTRRGKFSEGLKVDEQLSRLRPEDPLTHYNLACSYSLVGQFELAIASLDKAITLGYRDFQWLSRDPDLKDLRKHPSYRSIRDKVKMLGVQSR